MRVSELIEAGVCEDMEEALQMFPLEMLDDFWLCGPQGLVHDGVLGVVNPGDATERA